MPIDDRKEFGDAAIEEMTNGNGISVAPVLITVGHGYHPETGEDVITFGGHDHTSRHLLTQVMKLPLAREASAELARQIALVDRLNAAKKPTTTKGSTK
ncbi:MAG: hypothetical protein JWR34_4329 [Mycobacterium sp.]|nr:hypothetical protein [Mycobacterium sp.]